MARTNRSRWVACRAEPVELKARISVVGSNDDVIINIYTHSKVARGWEEHHVSKSRSDGVAGRLTVTTCVALV